MAGFSDYLEDKVLDHVFGGNAYTAPGTHYVAYQEHLLFLVQTLQQLLIQLQ
jgi:hypothetical protein